MIKERSSSCGRSGTIKSSVSAALCAALILLSPGLECYAVVGDVVRIQATDAVSPVSGPLGQASESSLQTGPASLALGPINLLGANATALSVPSVSEGLRIQAGAVAPVAPLADEAVAIAAKAGSSVGPADRLAASETGPARTPRSGASVQAFLQTEDRQIAQATGLSGRKAVLDAVFTGDQSKTAGESVVPAGTSFSSLAGAQVYLTQAGQAPVAATLANLGNVLAADPALKEKFNKLGRIRVVLSKPSSSGGLFQTLREKFTKIFRRGGILPESSPSDRLTQADLDQVRDTLTGYGLTAKLEVENLPIDWSQKKKQNEPADGPAATSTQQQSPEQRSRLWRYIIGPLTWPFRELFYLAHTFVGSLTTPAVSELSGGILTKGGPFIFTVGMWHHMYMGHPVATAIAIALSFTLDAFHGIWINSWSNFQNNIGKQRGFRYQAVFNFFYGQWWGIVFRTLAWSVIPKTVPPWSLHYWKDVGLSTILGTFFGTLGYQGMNILYNNGRLTRFQRSAIQQGRDIFFVLCGTAFGAGSMHMFWWLFAAQQALDLGIYIMSQRARRRPILYVADELVAASPEFQGMYPVGPNSGAQESPLKQALNGLVGSPFVKPFVWLGKTIWKSGKNIFVRPR